MPADTFVLGLGLAGHTFRNLTEWEPLFYVFRHYVGRGAELGRAFRATSSPVTARR